MKSKLLPSKAELAAAKRAGRHGDTDLIHANKREEAILAALGGAGTRNPKTGLLEFYSDSANEHSRAETGHNMADHSRPGDMSGTAAGGRAGGRTIYDDIKIADPVTQKILNPDIYGGIVVSKNGKVYSSGNNDLDYNEAIDKYNHRTTLDKITNFFAPLGLSSIKPDYARPATYAAGDFHTGINPASAVAGLAAGFLAPGAGLLAAPIAGATYDALGFKDPVLTGPRTIYADDGTGGTARDNSPAAAQSTGTSTANGDRPGRGDLLQPIMGNPSAAAPTTPATPTPPGGSALPPVTVPQGGQMPGAYMPIPGRMPYGWERPAWTYP